MAMRAGSYNAAPPQWRGVIRDGSYPRFVCVHPNHDTQPHATACTRAALVAIRATTGPLPGGGPAVPPTNDGAHRPPSVVAGRRRVAPRQLEVLPLTNHAYLRRIRVPARMTLVLGAAASIAANVLHARDNLVSQGIAAWPPLALLLTVELVSRVPVHRRGLAVIRIGATTAIAGIAAWVSYWHMAGVTARYGESPVSAHLMPLCVDGLVVAASISLVELAGRIRALDAAATQPAPSHARTPARTASTATGTRPPAKTAPARTA